MRIPRILLAAGASGSGKTLITCGLLQALVNRGLKVSSFKCGPDYIDPMFHSRVIGTKSANLDTFFTSDEVTRYLLGVNACGSDIAVMEGVMGYYDGVAGTTTKASAYDLASVTETPVILIVNSKGMSVSLAAYVKGFLEYKENSQIKGVIFNQMSPMLYPRMKKMIESELGIRVLGYVPRVEDCVIESRHLGLVLPEEIPELRERLQKLAQILEKSLEMDAILELAGEASEVDTISGQVREVSERDTISEQVREVSEREMISELAGAMTELYSLESAESENTLCIGVADDEAFCFFYKDNFRLLEQMGAKLVPFSPIHDTKLPENLDGMLLYGGYPELNAKALEDNRSMREEIASVLRQGMPCMAECGGFMYLHETMEDMNGVSHEMVGVIEGHVFRTSKLSRFGYVTLERNIQSADAEEIDLGPIPAHEFHYYDSTNCGNVFHASKPASTRGWDCMHDDGRILAGFPHLYYYGNPKVAELFLSRCLAYKREKACGAESAETDM